MNYYIGIASGAALSCASRFLFCKEEGLGYNSTSLLQGVATSAATNAIANLVVQNSSFWKGCLEGATFCSCYLAARDLGDEHFNATVAEYETLKNLSSNYISIREQKEKNFFTVMLITTAVLSERYQESNLASSACFVLKLAATLFGYAVPFRAYRAYIAASAPRKPI